jgi:hypothetical protein
MRMLTLVSMVVLESCKYLFCLIKNYFENSNFQSNRKAGTGKARMLLQKEDYAPFYLRY